MSSSRQTADRFSPSGAPGSRHARRLQTGRLSLYGDAPSPSATAAGARGSVPGEPSLFYDPPYATPLAGEVAWQLVKFLDDRHGLLHDVSGPAAGAFTPRADFVVETDRRRVGLVYTPPATDLAGRLQDALLVGSGALDAVYRVGKTGVVYRLHDVLWLLSRWEPALFSPRGRTNLVALASPLARSATPTASDVDVTLTYDDAGHRPSASTVALLDTDLPVPSTLALHRRLRPRPDTWRADYDRTRARFAPPAAPALGRTGS